MQSFSFHFQFSKFLFTNFKYPTVFLFLFIFLVLSHFFPSIFFSSCFLSHIFFLSQIFPFDFFFSHALDEVSVRGIQGSRTYTAFFFFFSLHNFSSSFFSFPSRIIRERHIRCFYIGFFLIIYLLLTFLSHLLSKISVKGI